ncbi:MAG: cysteine--tRNA ligase [Gammaproteobacteria bacterium]
MKQYLYNSLTGKKEEFSPIDESNIRMYVCGPTVYNFVHIGNARPAVVFDTLVRVLRANYEKVTYVSNITDIDDKIIDAAALQKVPISEITQKYTDIYNQNMEVLGVQTPDIQPKATEYLPEMIELIAQLIEKGFAYEKDGHVLFHVLAYEKYGALSKRNRDEQIAGSRVEVAPYKKDPADFILWKPSNSEQPGWDSPWGFGRPGWHTECSAMTEKNLGLPFDIHGGGRDLIFPHHENEIAQSCCASGDINNPQSFSKYWIHNGFVTVEGEKMSKSIGNVILVKDLINQYDGEVIRLALLSSHYRQSFDWNAKIIHQAQVLLDKLYEVLLDLSDENVEIKTNEEFINFLNDDLNTPRAITFLNKKLKEYSAGVINKKDFKQILLFASKTLGILNNNPEDWFRAKVNNLDEEEINSLIEKRKMAKANKDFKTADAIRDQLKEMGVEIMDSVEGTSWKPL